MFKSFKIIILIQFLISIFLIYFLKSFFIKKFFNYSAPREFLSMGEHSKKGNISSFGGFVFFTSLIPLFFFSLNEPRGWLIFFASLFSGLIGFIDDFFKKKYKTGLSAKKKFIFQGLFSLLSVIIWKYFDINFTNNLLIGSLSFDLKYFYFLWATLVIISTSHAVNLTDGIDGLASSQVIIILLNLILYISNINIEYSYLSLLSIFLLGPLLVFFKKNRYPAKIFMGDVGSLFLGSYLASLFLIFKIEILLIISGGIFVIETLSVIIQYLSFKIRKKRFFLFAPIHHDLEKRGFSENKIVLIASILSIFFQFLFFLILKN